MAARNATEGPIFTWAEIFGCDRIRKNTADIIRQAHVNFENQEE